VFIRTTTLKSKSCSVLAFARPTPLFYSPRIKIYR